MAAEALARSRAWLGALSLRVAHDGRRTFVARRQHEGPFLVQQPFYPGDGACHVYLLHPPGGLAAGDRLVLDVHVEPCANVLLTTPASTKFYRSDGAASTLEQRLRVAAGASLEWLPESSILFGGSRAEIVTEVELDPAARFIGMEMLSLGRPLSGDSYAAGSLVQRLHVRSAGEPLLTERLKLSAGEPILDEDWGFQARRVFGTQLAYPAEGDLLLRAREQLREWCGGTQRAAATLLGKLLVIRALGNDPEAVRNLFHALWSALRPEVIGMPACAPRIWRT